MIDRTRPSSTHACKHASGENIERYFHAGSAGLRYLEGWEICVDKILVGDESVETEALEALPVVQRVGCIVLARTHHLKQFNENIENFLRTRVNQ
jgi:uncharacterized protein with ACT and thioredoxin-like domain